MRLFSNLHVKGKPAVLPDHVISRQSHYFIYRPRILFLTGNHSLSSSKHSSQKSCNMKRIFILTLRCHINSYTIWDYTNMTEWLRMTLSRSMYSSNTLESGVVINLQLFLEAHIFSCAFCLQTLAMSEVINGGGNLQIL